MLKEGSGLWTQILSLSKYPTTVKRFVYWPHSRAFQKSYNSFSLYHCPVLGYLEKMGLILESWVWQVYGHLSYNTLCTSSNIYITKEARIYYLSLSQKSYKYKLVITLPAAGHVTVNKPYKTRTIQETRWSRPGFPQKDDFSLCSYKTTLRRAMIRLVRHLQ